MRHHRQPMAPSNLYPEIACCEPIVEAFDDGTAAAAATGLQHLGDHATHDRSTP